MLLNVDFVVIFSGFINRYYLSKRSLFNFNNNLFNSNLIFVNQNDFFILFSYFIIFNSNNLFNIKKFIIKDYKFFYIIEHYLKFKVLFIKKWFYFFYNWKKRIICLFSSFKLRINVILFFTLGKYVEFLRLFLYNEYLNIFKSFNILDIQFLKKNLNKSKVYIDNNFKKLISKGIYIFYYNYINKNLNEFSILKLRDKDLIFNNNIFNKYLKYFFFYYRLIFFFLLCFIDYLRPYYILFSYKCWKDYGLYFRYLSKVQISSLFVLYKILSKIKLHFDYFFIHYFINYLKKKVNNLFFQNNLSLLLLKNNFSLVNMNNDIIIINYISKLYYQILNSYSSSDNIKLQFDFITFWDIIEDWYHFDYILLPNLYKSSKELFLWLDLFKYNLELIIWNIFNKNIFNNYISSNLILNLNFINVDIKLDFISLIFFDILCNYFFKYILKYFYLFKVVFIFNFINDYCIKLFYNNSYNNCCYNLNYLRIKQFKYFYLNCLIKHRYIKIYNFYLTNINFY